MIICAEQGTTSLEPPVYYNILIPSIEGTKYWLKTGTERQNAEFYYDTQKTKTPAYWHSFIVWFSVIYSGDDYSSNG